MAAFTSTIPQQDLYGLLDVAREASQEGLRVAYRKAIRRAHPDKGGSSEAYLAVSRAFDVLSNPASRSSYDAAQGHKRRREEPKKSQESLVALANLHEALRAMDASSRRSSISSLSVEMRAKLVKFMETFVEPPKAVKELSSGSSSIRLRCKGLKYSAQMDIDCLRSYTRQVSFDIAIEHQLVLSELRDKLLKADEVDPCIWSPPFKVCDVFQEVLSAHETCPKKLGLSIFVQLRASEWVANHHSLTSPVLSFADAVALRFRLLSATTWPVLREEWLGLLQTGRRKLDQASAVSLVDTARAEFLAQKFKNAVKQVERATVLEDTEVVPYLSAEVLKIHTVQEQRRRGLQRNPRTHDESE